MFKMNPSRQLLTVTGRVVKDRLNPSPDDIDTTHIARVMSMHSPLIQGNTSYTVHALIADSLELDIFTRCNLLLACAYVAYTGPIPGWVPDEIANPPMTNIMRAIYKHLCLPFERATKEIQYSHHCYERASEIIQRGHPYCKLTPVEAEQQWTHTLCVKRQAYLTERAKVTAHVDQLKNLYELP